MHFAFFAFSFKVDVFDGVKLYVVYYFLMCIHVSLLSALF
jgi:hypothetical protein